MFAMFAVLGVVLCCVVFRRWNTKEIHRKLCMGINKKAEMGLLIATRTIIENNKMSLALDYASATTQQQMGDLGDTTYSSETK